MEFWSETKHTARKQHHCEACGQAIKPDERYSYMASKQDGQFWTIKQHEECRAAEVGLAELHDLYGGDEWIWLGELEETEDLLWLRDHHPLAFERIKARYDHWLETDDA